MAAAASVAAGLGLPVDEAVVLQNSNKLALRLLPCDVFARVAIVGQEVAALEVELARELATVASPVAALDPRVAPQPYEHEGFIVTFWTFCEASPDPITPVAYADALRRLHAGMRGVTLPTPHFTDRIAEAEGLALDRARTPRLADADRELLIGALQGGRSRVLSRGAPEQLLHGEPHPGNLLNTPAGPVFIDLETCCRGPIEFDVAHAPEEVASHYPGLDQDLLDECRGLILAMVAAWRWDANDQFPDGHEHGLRILGLLQEGPPWPALGALT